jgi:hypothetical protein
MLCMLEQRNEILRSIKEGTFMNRQLAITFIRKKPYCVFRFVASYTKAVWNL